MRLNFPFTAVAGQQQLKLALSLAAVNPALGGVLISGPRGSAKSTLARGLADVMPEPEGQAHPFVNLPLSTSEEMLIGTLDLQKVLDDQSVAFQPGLLAKADGGVLYVDEVNLLPDSLVDLLLDVSASGVNVIERDGVSHSHRAEFILLGTMNPDEGELRPQLQDRFGLMVELSNQYSVAERVEIVRLREAFDQCPETFVAEYTEQQQQLSCQIASARGRLSTIGCDDHLRQMIAERCHTSGVDGLRADIVWYRAALAHAALSLRDGISETDINAVEELVLAHRRNEQNDSKPPSSGSPSGNNKPSTGQQQQSNAGDWGSMASEQQKTANLTKLSIVAEEQASPHSYPAQQSRAATKQKGFAVGRSAKRAQLGDKINWFTTLINNAGRWPLQSLRFQKRPSGRSVLNLVLLDTSASTLKNQLFGQAKAVVLQIAEQAYLAREELSILGFGNQQLSELMTRKRAPKQLRRFLDDIPAAGGTPLREILLHAADLQAKVLKQNPTLSLRTYLITDGRTTQSFDDVQLQGSVMVIDIEQSAVKRGKAPYIADVLRADYFPLATTFSV